MIFEEREPVNLKFDPRVKLLSLIFFFIICLLPSKLYSSLILFLLSIFISLLLKLTKNVLRAKFILLTVFFFTVLLWLISNGLRYLEPSISIALKLDSMVVGGIIFVSITRQDELFFALRKFFIPFRPSFAISLSMRFVPIILNLIETVIQAQKTRGYEIKGNPFEKVKRTIPLMGPVLLYVLRWTDKLSIAIEARGFSSSKRVDFYEWKMEGKDILFLFIFLSFVFLCIILRLKNII